MAKKQIKTTGASSGGKKTGNKTVLWIAGAVALGVAGFFGYKWWKKKKEEKDKKDNTGSGTFQQDATLPSSTGGGGGGGSTGGGGGGGGSYSSLATNPFSTSAELKAFQEYVINTKKDSAILGTAGADGKWGSKSAAAWEKYGADYKKGTSTSGGGETGYINWDQQADGYPNGITNRVVYWLQQAKSSKGKYAWGEKTSPNYMKASKYPSFFVEWAKAVKARAGKPGFYTTFKWNGAVYDSYQGIQRMKTSPQGKLIIAGDNTFAYDSAGKERYKVTKGNRAGTVSYYDFSDDQIWLKSNEKMPGGLQWYKSSYVTLV